MRTADPTAPVRLVETLTRLGPTFVKLGQVLSTRSDVLPPAYIEALSRLQADAPRVPFAALRAAVEESLGSPLETLFADFDEEPVAAASLAQVHRATLDDGSVVAVKVKRPGLDALMERDLDVLELALRWTQRLAPRRVARTNLDAFFHEFRRYTLRELDFAREGESIERFRTNFADRGDVRFPKVFPERTAHGVLTLEWVSGMDVHEAAERLPEDSRLALVRRVVDVLLQMFVSDGLFHADLHPGNVVFHEDGTFTLLDFGMIGELTEAQRDRFTLYMLAVVQRQTRRAFHHFVRQTRAFPGADREAFFERFSGLADAFYVSRLREVSFTKVYLGMMTAGYEHGFRFPRELMLHAKALTTAEALLFVLAPDARFEQIARPFVTRELLARAGSPDLVRRRVGQILPELLLLGEVLPREALDTDWDQEATAEIVGDLGVRARAALRRSLRGGGLWSALLAAHVRAVLGETKVGDVIDQILEETWSRYYELEPHVPVERSQGAVFTTHLAAATLALHQTLLAHGLSAEDSYQRLYAIGWRFYTQLGGPPLLLAAAFTRHPGKRLRLATDLFRTFPFGPPGYRWEDVPSTDDVVAFDCTRCPVAELFIAHEAAELCVRTWCQLDFPLAEQWGGQLRREGTLAMGRDRCDFRWHARPDEPS